MTYDSVADAERENRKGIRNVGEALSFDREAMAYRTGIENHSSDEIMYTLEHKSTRIVPTKSGLEVEAIPHLLVRRSRGETRPSICSYRQRPTRRSFSSSPKSR